MKMEVLSIQNLYLYHHSNNIQGQFGTTESTIGNDSTTATSKSKDWTTIPPAGSPQKITPSTKTTRTTATTPTIGLSSSYGATFHPIEFDVVDGIKPQHNNTQLTENFNSNSTINNDDGVAMETASATPSPSATHLEAILPTNTAHYAYNNNILYCAPNSNHQTVATPSSPQHLISPYHLQQRSQNMNIIGHGSTSLQQHYSPASSNLSTPTEATEHFGLDASYLGGGGGDGAAVGEYTANGSDALAGLSDVDAAAANELSARLQTELRAAKSRHLACTEVSLPWDLTTRIAAEMIRTSEREPCGVRGCAIFIDFEDIETGSARRIASFKVDPNTVSTFELTLTLKQDKGGWTSLLPQFLKNLTRRSNTILISPHFSLNKHKLYACE